MTEPKPETEQPKISPFEMEANRFIQHATSMYVNGLRASLPQAPVANLIVKTCSAFGVAVGTVLSIGALGDIFPMRQACVEAFSKGVKSVKIEPSKPDPRPLNS